MKVEALPFIRTSRLLVDLINIKIIDRFNEIKLNMRKKSNKVN